MCPWCNKEFSQIHGAPPGGIPDGATTVCTACGNFSVLRMPDKRMEKLMPEEFEKLDLRVQAMLMLAQRESRSTRDLDGWQLIQRHRNN